MSKESACRIICTGTLENGGMARPFPLCLYKRVATGRRCLFIISVGAGKFLGCEGFCRISQNLPETFFVQLLPTNFLPQRSFWCYLQKRSSCVFMQTLGAIFWSQITLGAIFAQIFSKSKLFGARLQSLHPISNTTAFLNIIIGMGVRRGGGKTGICLPPWKFGLRAKDF